MEEDISPASLNVTGESSSKVKLVVNAYGCFVESDERNEGHKITKCLSRGGGGGGRDKVWDRETMFSQLAKQSPCVMSSG